MCIGLWGIGLAIDVIGSTKPYFWLGGGGALSCAPRLIIHVCCRGIELLTPRYEVGEGMIQIA
jgi:hypothetical protein